jgi:deoxyribonuclease V
LIHDDAVLLQRNTAKKVLADKDDFGEISHICGVDVAYHSNDGRINRDTAYASAVIMDRNMQHIVESVDVQMVVKYPYIPGLLMLREGEPILHALRALKNTYDLLLIDGHGVLHPRRCGLACYIGVTLNKPTIGVAKSLLCGTVRSDQFIEFDSEILGYAMSKKLYISSGHRITLKTAIALLEEFGIEPLRLADINSRKNRKK